MRPARSLPLVVLLVVLAVGCADYVGEDVRSGRATIGERPEPAEGSATTATTLPPEPVGARTLETGACFDDVTDADGEPPPSVEAFRRGAEVVPRSCGDEHRYELYARDTIGGPDAAFPGAERLAEDADRFCEIRFEEFVDAPWGDLPLDYVTQVPTEAGWAEGDRTVACALIDVGLAPLEGSMEGRGA